VARLTGSVLSITRTRRRGHRCLSTQTRRVRSGMRCDGGHDDDVGAMSYQRSFMGLPGESWNTRHFTFDKDRLSIFLDRADLNNIKHQLCCPWWSSVVHRRAPLSAISLMVPSPSRPSCSSPAGERVARGARCRRTRGHRLAGGWLTGMSLTIDARRRCPSTQSVVMMDVRLWRCL